MISPDPAVNPLFFDANIAYLGYCDGGSYAGTVAEPQVVGNATIYYRGRHILDAFLDKVLSAGASAASEVVISGCSAGGLAVYIHADYIASRLPPTARVAAAPGAGFFLADFPGIDGQLHYLANYQWVASAMNVTPSVDAGCTAFYAATPDQLWRCFTAPGTLPFITTPVFVINSLADSWQAGNIMAWPNCDPRGSGCNARFVPRASLPAACES